MTNSELLLAMSRMMDTKLKSELQPLKEDMQGVKAEIKELKEDMQSVKAEVRELKEDMHNVKAEVHQLRLNQETVILPRLNTIESCYTGTYNRYRSYVEKMEAAFIDIDVLKMVVAEHSEKLLKLA